MLKLTFCLALISAMGGDYYPERQFAHNAFEELAAKGFFSYEVEMLAIYNQDFEISWRSKHSLEPHYTYASGRPNRWNTRKFVRDVSQKEYDAFRQALKARGWLLFNSDGDDHWCVRIDPGVTR